MSKRKAESECKREFNEEWENEFLFIASPAGKPLCIVSEATLAYNKKHDLNRHYKTQHQTKIKNEKKHMPGSTLRKEYSCKEQGKNQRKAMHLH